MLFLLAPFLAAVLASQSGAEKRLEQAVLRPHPAITESAGFGNGIGKNPKWVFEVNAQKDKIRKFYTSKANTNDWSLKTDSGALMRNRRHSSRR